MLFHLRIFSIHTNHFIPFWNIMQWQLQRQQLWWLQVRRQQQKGRRQQQRWEAVAVEPTAVGAAFRAVATAPAAVLEVAMAAAEVAIVAIAVAVVGGPVQRLPANIFKFFGGWET